MNTRDMMVPRLQPTIYSGSSLSLSGATALAPRVASDSPTPELERASADERMER